MRPLFELFPRPLLKSSMGPLTSIASPGDHKWATEQKYLPSDPRLEWPGRGHYSSGTQINAGTQNAATVRVIPWTIIEVRPGPLARYGTHQENISGRPE